MIKFICNFIPAIIAVGFTEYIDKKRFSLKKCIYYYALYVLSINFIISTILSTLFAGAQIYLYDASFSNSLVVKYIGFSFILSVILPILFSFIKINFNFEFKIEKDLKDSEQKKNKKQNSKK